jgi:hypothetical protein
MRGGSTGFTNFKGGMALHPLFKYGNAVLGGEMEFHRPLKYAESRADDAPPLRKVDLLLVVRRIAKSHGLRRPQ